MVMFAESGSLRGLDSMTKMPGRWDSAFAFRSAFQPYIGGYG